MLDWDTWQEISDTVQRNKLRTLMTAAGVFWGMFMLVLMLGFGNGLERGVDRKMGDFATNAVFVWGERTSRPYRGLQAGRWVEFDNSDVAAIRAEIDGIRYLSPRNQLGGYMRGRNVSHGNKTGSFQIMGDHPEYRFIEPMVMDYGRFVNPLDLAERRKVAVLGKQVYAELFAPGEDPIGQSVEVDGVWFVVIGVFHSSRAGEEAAQQEGRVQIPFTTFQQVFNLGDEVGWLAMVAEDELPAAELEKSVRALLAERHDVHPEDEQALGSFNSAEEFGKMRKLFAGIEMFVWVVGSITLAAGVLGVSNILLIVVRERTKEIGIRRAIGATPGQVVGLVMQEAVVLTTLAGALGLTAAVGLLELTARLVGPDNDVLGSPQVDLGVALTAIVVLVAGGAVAGVVPARHAARIHPVEALRSEG